MGFCPLPCFKIDTTVLLYGSIAQFSSIGEAISYNFFGGGVTVGRTLVRIWHEKHWVSNMLIKANPLLKNDVPGLLRKFGLGMRKCDSML